MKRTIFLLSALVSVAASASAEQISKDKAKTIAESFFQKGSVQTRAQSAEVKLIKEYASSAEAPTAIYAFTRAENLVFVSADDEMPSILGYSDNADPNNLPPALEAMLGSYSALTDAVRQGITRAPQLYASETTVDSLLFTLWDQTEPFCSLCPEKDGQLVPNGCVSTAFAQVMRYHKWPVHPTGVTPAYTTKPFDDKVPENDLTDHTYNWDDMPLDYSGGYTEEQGQAVAQLCYDVSTASKMNFNSSNSATDVTNGAYAMRKYFGYSKDLYVDYPDRYTEAEWAAKLKNEISLGRPIPYGGKTPDGVGGHCFVVDGFNAEGLFHVNWGWGGESNGYFLITKLNPEKQGIGGSSEGGRFIKDQVAVFNLVPDDETITASEHFIFQYMNITVLGGDSIYLNEFANRSIDEFSGDFVLQLVDLDDKVVGKQKVKTGNEYEKRITKLFLKSFDYSGIADGEYLPRWIAVSSATGNEFPMHAINDNSRIIVENGEFKEILICPKLEGKILSCEFSQPGAWIVNMTMNYQVTNIDKFDYIQGIIEPRASISYQDGATLSGTYSDPIFPIIAPDQTYTYTYNEIFFIKKNGYESGILTLKIWYPNGIMDIKEFPLKDIVTGITNVNTDQEVSEAPAYNLFGQPTQGQGFVVKNGRVVFVK